MHWPRIDGCCNDNFESIIHHWVLILNLRIFRSARI